MYVVYEFYLGTGRAVTYYLHSDVGIRLYGSECQWIVPGTVGVDD